MTRFNPPTDKTFEWPDQVTGLTSDPNVQQTLESTKSFYERNKPVVLTVAATVVLYKVNKRMVKKVVTKALENQVPQLVRNEFVGATLNDKFGVIGTFAQAVKA